MEVYQVITCNVGSEPHLAGAKHGGHDRGQGGVRDSDRNCRPLFLLRGGGNVAVGGGRPDSRLPGEANSARPIPQVRRAVARPDRQCRAKQGAHRVGA